jgi:hypothetical protein
MNEMKKITTRTLFERVRRAMARTGEHLRTCREDSKWFRDLGRYYAHDEQNNLTNTDIDLERAGRDFGCLRAGETVEAAW